MSKLFRVRRSPAGIDNQVRGYFGRFRRAPARCLFL